MPFADAATRKKYMQEYGRTWYQANKTKKDAQSRAWVTGNKVRFRELARESYRRNSTRPVRVLLTDEQRQAALIRKWRRKSWRRYGIDEEKATATLMAHNGLCGICGVDVPAKRRRDWCVDHDHITLRIRGILCHGCNMKLGWVDRVGLIAIESYLKEKQ